MGRAPSNFFRRFQKSERVSSRDSSVTMCRLLEDEISTVANNLLENFNSAKASHKLSQTKSEYSWWPLSTYSKLERIGGPEFGRWVSEYVPAYLFQINSDRLPDLKLEGWKRSAENRWEVLLTHNQMVALANILDMYYEDSYTLPSKQLSCGAVAKPINMYTNKLDAFCFSIVERIKVAFGWAGDIIAEKGVGAWIGELPVFLRGDADSNSGETPSCSVPIKENDEELKGSTQDIASYQVVLSDEGKIVGVQPTSLVAVNNWASNPLAKELYGGRKLSPGLIEPDLTIRRPSNVVVIEVLMSLNPDSRFALARPSKRSMTKDGKLVS